MIRSRNLLMYIMVVITVVILFMALDLTVFAAAAAPTASTVIVDGQNISFDAYNINDFNYFKLRDIALILSGSAKQFDVGWDEANDAISLTSGRPYTIDGSEMSGKGSSANEVGAAKEAAPTNSRIFLDGREVKFTAYNIDGFNYFKLRDIGEAINFGVDWDEALDTIIVDTNKGYSYGGGAAETMLTPLRAGLILQAWVESHPFQLGSELDPSSDGYSIGGDGYYRFKLSIIKLGVAEILVNDETGKLYHLSPPTSSAAFEPIDDWYNREHAAGAPAISAEKARTMYETWIETRPSMSHFVLSPLPNKIYEIDGNYYYWFWADYYEWYWYNVLIDINSGNMLYMMISDGEETYIEIEPLDDFFDKYSESGV